MDIRIELLKIADDVVARMEGTEKTSDFHIYAGVLSNLSNALSQLAFIEKEKPSIDKPMTKEQYDEFNTRILPTRIKVNKRLDGKEIN
ncbi:hypothetical protein [Lactobacillus taiwanensis]|uniref:hypothetical protein n=1 Tax=Lactobacillus taiwanensis TaxID=508451 RepID=UPI0025A9E08E|nr:hypothetical protein [Lactobacillus taiwanensis]